MKKKSNTLVLCVISSISLILFDFYKFDLLIHVEGKYNFVAGLGISWLALFIYGLYGILVIWSYVYIFTQFKSINWKALIPAAVTSITVILLLVFPYTEAYVNLDYSINKDNFQKTVQMANHMENYLIGEGEYIVPYRLTSYSGVLNKADGTITKMMFYAYSGFGKCVVIIYTADDSGINSEEFSEIFNIGKWKYSNIRKLDTNWYSATVSDLYTYS